MNWRVRYTKAAREDLLRLYGFLLEQDVDAAQRALDAIEKGIDLLRSFPFTCRKADPDNPFLRELLVSFGASGYVALYEIGNGDTVTLLAIRHQREDDYH
ncbi:type II toxin-antitoxin system RelE/ParE family toxin [Rhodanobacter sp. DHB23]|uniref:type II toxin-antitoxin system RelE/ParE family toxin n=1 Tax=Rhodanobacter sp. DHB23 TaxID=2775923 RepID=UPI0017872E1A|nr:type II toxin-antitoxin system RelE/ParE family toxin [Rhodanobacter sp. DHB23]